jgi:hypothetical protein
VFAINILHNKTAQAFSLTIIAVFLFGQVAHATQCTMTFPDNTKCLITYKPVAKINNAAYALSKASCDKNKAKVQLGISLQHKTPYGAWHTVNTDTVTTYNGYAVVDVDVGCRYGSSHSWRNITYVWVNNVYGGSLTSATSTIGCDI